MTNLPENDPMTSQHTEFKSIVDRHAAPIIVLLADADRGRRDNKRGMTDLVNGAEYHGLRVLALDLSEDLIDRYGADERIIYRAVYFLDLYRRTRGDGYGVGENMFRVLKHLFFPLPF